MRPILFELPLPGGGTLTFAAYGTLLVLGMLGAVWASRRHGSGLGVSTREVFDLGLLLLVGGVAGARLLHLIVFPDLYFRGEGAVSAIGRIFSTWNGGLVYYGGLAGGSLVLWAWSRRKKLPYLEVLDFVAPLGALGLATTRLGCHLTGCCFGAATKVPWALVLPASSPAGRRQAATGLIPVGSETLPVHPVQLYEMAVAVGVFVLLQWAYPRRRFRGECAAAFGAMYGGWRLVAEVLRADPAPGRDGVGLSVYSWMSLGLLAISLVAWRLGLTAAEPARGVGSVNDS